MTNHFCHIEISATDLKSAQEFYGKLFSWKLDPSGTFPGYTMFETGKEPGGGLQQMERINPGEGVIIYVAVEDVDATLKRAKELGGTIVREKTEIPKIGWFGLFKDLDGNLIGIFKGI